MARILVTVLTLLSFTACTTLQPLPDAQPATIRDAVHAGDSVELVKTDGTQLTLKVEEVSDAVLTGTDRNTRYRIPLGEIQRIGTQTMDTTSTVWTAVGVAAAIGVIIAVSGSGGGGGGGGGSGPGY